MKSQRKANSQDKKLEFPRLLVPIIVAVIVISMTSGITVALNEENTSTKETDDETISINVGFENEIDMGLIEKVNGEINVKIENSNSVSFDVSYDIGNMILDSWEEKPDVKYVEEDEKGVVIPEWDINSIEGQQTTATEEQWGIYRIDVPEAHEHNKGEGVDVAILDTGIDADHDSLNDNVKGGVDYVGDDEHLSDPNGHGTHVAGTIAGNCNEILGTAPGVNLYSVRVLDEDGKGNNYDLAKGIEWSYKNDMEIISMSLGGTDSSEMVEDEIENAYNSGSLLVGAAGIYVDGDVFYPAAYDQVIAVSSIDENDEFDDSSNYGEEIELTAPGVEIYSTWPDDEYKVDSGTSFAVPHVSGVAALLFSKADADASNEDTYIRNQIIDDLGAYAEDIGLDEEYQGNGLVNAHNSVVYGGDRSILISSGDDGGSVSPYGTFQFYTGQELQIEATPNSGYLFDEWTDDNGNHICNDNPTTLVVDDDLPSRIVGNFKEGFELTLAAGNHGTTSPVPGTHLYEEGEEVNVVAYPDNGYDLKNWTYENGEECCTSSTITVEMNEDKYRKAYFEETDGGGGGGGGCPYISPWTGEEYERDNNLLIDSEYKDEVVEDHYILEKELEPENDSYQLKVEEFKNTENYFDEIGLYTIDHPKGFDVGTTPEGELVAYQKQGQLQLKNRGDNSYIDANSELRLDFEQIIRNDLSKMNGVEEQFILIRAHNYESRDEIQISNTIDDVSPNDVVIKSNLELNADYRGRNLQLDIFEGAEMYPRNHESDILIPVSSIIDELPSSIDIEELELVINNDEPFYLESISLAGSTSTSVKVQEAELERAIFNRRRDVTEELNSKDSEKLRQIPGDEIHLTFKKPAGFSSRGLERSFMIYSLGRYELYEEESDEDILPIEEDNKKETTLTELDGTEVKESEDEQLITRQEDGTDAIDEEVEISETDTKIQILLDDKKEYGYTPTEAKERYN